MLFSAPAGAKNRTVGPARDHDRSTVSSLVDMAGKFDSRTGNHHGGKGLARTRSEALQYS